MDDVYDIRSVTSTTSNPTGTAHATISEYRSVQSRRSSSKNQRVRKSRQFKSQTGPESVVSTQDSRAPDSPDVLALGSQSPPPANIVSDLVGGRGPAKRARAASFSEPHVKRSKPTPTNESIDVSEDELSVVPCEDTNGAVKRRTNFSSLNSHSQRRPRSKGDIIPTDFGISTKSKADKARKDLELPLEKAVSGTNYWESTESQRAALVPDDAGSYEFRIRETNEQQSEDDASDSQESPVWTRIPLMKITQVQHHSTHSKYVRISRMTSPGAPASMMVQFSTRQGAMLFVNSMPLDKLLECSE